VHDTPIVKIVDLSFLEGLFHESKGKLLPEGKRPEMHDAIAVRIRQVTQYIAYNAE
jgi:hypothetical protein